MGYTSTLFVFSIRTSILIKPVRSVTDISAKEDSRNNTKPNNKNIIESSEQN